MTSPLPHSCVDYTEQQIYSWKYHTIVAFCNIGGVRHKTGVHFIPKRETASLSRQPKITTHVVKGKHASIPQWFAQLLGRLSCRWGFWLLSVAVVSTIMALSTPDYEVCCARNSGRTRGDLPFERWSGTGKYHHCHHRIPPLSTAWMWKFAVVGLVMPITEHQNRIDAITHRSFSWSGASKYHHFHHRTPPLSTPWMCKFAVCRPCHAHSRTS